MTDAPILVSKKQAAKLLGISTGMVDKLRRQRRIEAVRLGARVMFRREDVLSLALTPSQRRALSEACGGLVQ